MELRIPVLTELVPTVGAKRSVYRVSALFVQKIQAEHPLLSRATQRLTERLRKELTSTGRSWNHHPLLLIGSHQEIQGVRLKLSFTLRNRSIRLPFFFAMLRLHGRQVAFAPKLPHLWFDIPEDATLEQRATEVFEDFFRQQEKNEVEPWQPESFKCESDSWISFLEMTVRDDPVSDEEIEKRLLALFSNERADGATELYRVGRCLDERYPDRLDRALFRTTEIEQLENLLQHPIRRGIVLIGGNGVGKSTIVHELVYRHVDFHERQFRKPKSQFWSLSPQRMISGMMYIGQWEDRVSAIIDEAAKRNHVLCIDDPISMFRAGQSRESNLSVGDLFKNALDSRSIRLIIEMTPDQWHTMSTRFRGFADLLLPVRIWPTDEQNTLKIAIRALQELEIRHRCRFSKEVLPNLIHLQKDHARLVENPGKVLTPLKSLAVRFPGEKVRVNEIYSWYQTTTGLRWSMLDDQRSMHSSEIYQFLAARIIGQKPAISVLTKVVNIASARLNEPNRPLATLLFLGPTGVGKTESAKAVCDLMFNHREHLVRFDLNQFKSPFSAMTLVGTPDQPEGLLTAAVRQKPFCILLLDEIEKAHRDVHDILLQVLGEGRLTDGLGRTCDFSNCLIIMTSNLGTETNRRNVGFKLKDQKRHYIQAAEKFFRPEFFNRIDHIVPFADLQPQHIDQIARQQVASLIRREGLARRQCVLQIDPPALQELVQLGYHPALGARAMKRTLEHHLARPVAMELAQTPVNEPRLVRVFIRSNENDSTNNLADESRFGVETTVFQHVQSTRDPQQVFLANEVVGATDQFIARMEPEIKALSVKGPIGVAQLTLPVLKYFSLLEQLTAIQERVKTLKSRLKHRPPPPLSRSAIPPARFDKKPDKAKHNNAVDGRRRLLRDLMDEGELKDFFLDSIQPLDQRGTDPAIDELVGQCALLEGMIAAEPENQLWLMGRFFQELKVGAPLTGETILEMRNQFAAIQKFLITCGFEVEGQIFSDLPIHQPSFLVLAKGPFVDIYRKYLVGSYLTINSNGTISVFQLIEIPTVDQPTEWGSTLPREAEWFSWLLQWEQKYTEPSPTKATGSHHESKAIITDQHHPLRIQPVVQICDRRKFRLDLRSGVSQPGNWSGEQWKKIFLLGLPLPQEFIDDSIHASTIDVSTGAAAEAEPNDPYPSGGDDADL